ncbi:amidase family protein [Jatrophihabitans sp.]|uniref:amidase family protein n=1 Tax=Jatrophihabitans sp. TaxID=1932789 RepID=UPI002B78B0DB|nr:amidase family protein [Jatrophihabitans sp.]
MPSPAEHTAAEAGRLLADGTLTARELSDFYLDRISRLDPQLNAVLAVDADGAREAAEASDARRRAGIPLGPLDGVPVLIKDNIEAVGLPGTAGSRALLGSPPDRDAPLIERLRGAGLVLLGATNLSEWANFRSTASTSGWSAVGGQTRNPFDPGRNTSGSSSGSAAAVAAGLVPLAVGTETDGSIVSPAGVCGVVGFKPTLGRVPGAGIVPISSRQDTAGPMARTVADAAALFAVLAGGIPRWPQPGSLAGRRVALWRPDGMTDEVTATFDAVAERLRQAGCTLAETRAATSSPFEDAEFAALLAEFSVELPAYLRARPGEHPREWDELLAFNRADEVELSRFSDEIFGLCAELEGGVESEEYRRARDTADSACRQALAEVLGDAEFALAPTNSPAWPISYGGPDEHGLLTSSLCAVTGAPSVSLPAGTGSGLPIGVSVLGRRGDDERLLAFAADLQAVLPVPRFPEL